MLSYRKAMNMYSVGLIQVEIALWKLDVAVMSIEDSVDRSPQRRTHDSGAVANLDSNAL